MLSWRWKSCYCQSFPGDAEAATVNLDLTCQGCSAPRTWAVNLRYMDNKATELKAQRSESGVWNKAFCGPLPRCSALTSRLSMQIEWGDIAKFVPSGCWGLARQLSHKTGLMLCLQSVSAAQPPASVGHGLSHPRLSLWYPDALVLWCRSRIFARQSDKHSFYILFTVSLKNVCTCCREACCPRVLVGIDFVLGPLRSPFPQNGKEFTARDLLLILP